MRTKKWLLLALIAITFMISGCRMATSSFHAVAPGMDTDMYGDPGIYEGP